MSLPSITGEFGVVRDPEMRFADGGRPWLKIRGAAKQRKRDDNNNWVDGETCYIDIIVGGKQAEHLLESVTTGDTILVSGDLQMREWTDKDGNKQTSYQINAKQAGVSTQFGTAVTPRASASKPMSPQAVAASFAQEDRSPF